MGDIRWDILQPVDIGGRIQQGYEHAQQSALQQRERTRAEGLRNALTGAINPTTGAINYGVARRAYIGAGDLEGAMGVDAGQRASVVAALASHRDRINFAGETMQQHPVTDQASWTALLEAARQAGYDVSDQPPTFDPAHVAGIQHAYTTLQRQEPGYTVGQGETRYRGDGSVEARGAPPPPRYYSVQAGGRLESPDIPATQGQPPADVSNLPRASTPADIAHLAPGSWFIAPDNLPHQVPGGAPQPQAASTFPGVW